MLWLYCPLNQNKFSPTSDLRPGLFVCRYVSIRSLSFSPDGQFLCASSNTETVHIFKLEQLGPRYVFCSRLCSQVSLTRHVCPLLTFFSRVQWSRWGCHLDGLRGENVLSSQQLPPCSGVGHDEPGPRLRHRSPALVRPGERLHLGCVSIFLIFN